MFLPVGVRKISRLPTGRPSSWRILFPNPPEPIITTSLAMSARPSRQSRQQKALTTMAAAAVVAHPRQFNRRVSPTQTIVSVPLHMDECADPDCADLLNMKDYQDSIDHFTDYDNYERCCDGNHADGKCCTNTTCHYATSAEDCDDCFDDCDDCLEEHQEAVLSRQSPALDAGTPIQCDDDCEKCEEECEEQGHDKQHCPHDHHTSWDSCISTCGACVDPNPLPLLPSDAELHLYGLNSLMPHITPCTDHCTPPPPPPLSLDALNLGYQQTRSMFDTALDHWQTFQQAHHCAPDPCLSDHLPDFQVPQHVQPNFGFSFGCDPSIPGHQYPWQQHSFPQVCALQTTADLELELERNRHIFPPPNVATPDSSVSIALQSRPESTLKPGKICQWLMPCGSPCTASFARTDDLKKHIKNSHLCSKGTVTCRWGHCTATFGTEAALTGHVSKKHLAPLYAAAAAAAATTAAATGTTSTGTDASSPLEGTASTPNLAEELPWKCTHPGCTKSFAYKQVRDDHLASHTGSNRVHCPICHQWLNGEGSNFRRHMASHRPENEHMKCKHQHLGCKRKFPRLDNLRRHEACCKFGKKAALAGGEMLANHHHHHHHHKIAQ